MVFKLFAILQKYEFSSKSQLSAATISFLSCCLRYCKSTSFQANHNDSRQAQWHALVVCDTAKVRVFKQITTQNQTHVFKLLLFAILQKYEFSSKSQLMLTNVSKVSVVCDTAKVRVFKQITTSSLLSVSCAWLFAILQKYEFSSKSQRPRRPLSRLLCCLRYCKSTSFQANHNVKNRPSTLSPVVCDTAKVRVFKQITTKWANL